MEDGKTDTCAVLDADKQRIARGRFELAADKRSLVFKPASNVTPAEMARVAFLWPDGEDTIAVSNAQPGPDSNPNYRLETVS